MTSAIRMSRTREPEQQGVKLLESVVTHRVDAYAKRLFASYGNYGHEACAIITQYIQQLKIKCNEEFGKWSVAELQAYRQWQTSPIVAKINQAKPGHLEQSLTQDEMILLENFRKSALGQKKTYIDISLKPIVSACHEELEEKIIAPAVY
ncbi:MAG: hypothetical protein JSR37_01040 [Verrucomicrobia bacterium]|nr:hypothetical protein [Verrucomicrobiota bacterium]MBS0636762.1 hypothetical protein [Verrucomicrobiota bacterium]